MLQHELYEYPTPRNLSYWWNFGSLAGIMLVVMIVTGVFLAMQYTPHADYAFDSVERIMRDVDYGWMLRYAHMNGASMFFAIVYIHLFRGLYYGSYKQPRELLWILGVIILILMIMTAFMGYVLPWGQMSYWAATVITNLFSAIPVVGQSIVTFLWGGFTVGNPTLNRFYALHYLLPFIIVAVVLLHLIALHRFGSNNPLGIDMKGPQDTLPFHPYFTIKDLFGLTVFLLVYAFFVFYAPNFLGSADNYIPANPMQTPNHIVPEWYLLPYYAILRSVPNKLLGVILLFPSLIIRAADEAPRLPHQEWSFDGVFGTYDRASAQRGFQVYKEVCSACHPVKHLYFRDLADLGYSEDEVKAIASTYQVTNEQPNDQGEMYQRPGRPSDRIPGPFPNDQAARAANNGALPPDLSMIVKARPGGPNYVYAILTGYKDPPPDFNMLSGMNYNEYFPC